MSEPTTNGWHGDEIAVVGMVCRLPGASTICDYWSNLQEGVESITFLDDDDLRAAGIGPELLSNPAYVKSSGGVIEGIDLFDASFFGFAPREAEVMDPQQRLFLEAAHQALEDAGYDPETYHGSIGVFAGAGRSNYLLENLLTNPRLLQSVGVVQATLGSDKDFVPTRVSYCLDLRGPSINVQASCSTSLVAAHLACQSLIAGESDLALAGGVSITTLRKTGYLYEEGGVYAPDGHCRSFDADAKGMVGANGLAVVVLKRLSDALEDGDTVHGVILGSAVNNDGSLRVGFTAPGVDGQAIVVSEAIAAADIDARSIGYIEADGTGTPLGDPIEVAALTQAFREQTDDVGFCALGTVKTNIGHTNAASGAAGLIKAILSLEHRTLPPSINFSRPNPEIDFASSPFYVNTEAREWPTSDTPRRAGVSSIGMGGTNAHLVLQEAPPLRPTDPGRPQNLVVLSARTATALDQATTNLVQFLENNPDADLADVSYTLQVGRRGFDHRRMVVSTDTADAAQALRQLDPKRVLTAQRVNSNPPVAFMFPGQGAQYPGMGRQLYESEEGFRHRVDTCAELLREPLGLDLREVLYPDEVTDEHHKRLAQTWLTQPAIFTIEYALAGLWMDWGVQPSAMIGHSVGEFVAACIAGVLSLEDALALVATRGRMMQDLPEGDMLSVPFPESEIAPLLGDDLSLSAVNGPALCVVSGPRAAVAALQERLAREDLPCRVLHTSHAFHSAMIDPIVEPFREIAAKASLAPATIPCVSTVTGTWIKPEDWSDPNYWAANLRQPVRFSAGAHTLLDDPDRVLLEVGPGQTLSELVRQHGPDAAGHTTVPTLRHPRNEQSDVEFLLTSLGRLWLAGARVEWQAFHGEQRRRRIPLPTYPFERKRYWVGPAREVGEERHSAAKRSDVGSWFYAPLWRQAVTPEPAEKIETAQAGCWVCLMDGQGLAERIAARITDPVVRVEIGDEYRQLDERHYRIRAGEREDYRTLIQSIQDAGLPPKRVVHAFCIEGGAGGPSLASLEDSQHRGFYSLLFLAQALDELSDTPVHIDFLTDGLHPVLGSEANHPERATALGPCRVIPREFDRFSCRNIDITAADLSEADIEAVLGRVIAECAAEPSDEIVAYRGAKRCVPCYDPVRLELKTGGRAIREGGTYLVTGGLGGVGSVLAEHVAGTPGTRIILVGRAALPPRASWDDWIAEHGTDDQNSRRIQRVRALEARGAEVEVATADVADLDAMRAVVDAARARFGEIHGVIHAAGLATGGMIGLRTAAEAASVLQPKVDGTLVLEELLRGDPLDFFVLCSSLASIMPGLGAADYCGANAFLGALAHAPGNDNATPFVTIGWDTWSEVGMAVETEVPAELRRERQEFLRKGILSEEGKEVLDRILANPLRHVLVSTHDLMTRLEPVNTPESEPGVEDREASAVADPTAGHMRPDLSNPYVAPDSELQQSIAAVWQELLGVDRVGIHDNFFELGGHSLAGTRVAARLRQTFKVDVPLRQLFEAPTVAELADYVETTRWASAAPDKPRGTDSEDREEIEI